MDNAPLPLNMLKHLRLSRRGKGVRPLTQKELAAMAGIPNVETISKIERGVQNPTAEQAIEFARIFNVDPAVFFDRERKESTPAPGFAEETVPFVPEPDSFASRIPLSQHQSWHRIEYSRLDEIGIIDKDEVVIDIGKQAMSSVAIGDVVIANHYSTDGKSAETIVRQWIPPLLLITNSRSRNLLPLHIEQDNVAVLGVVVYPRRNPQQRLMPFSRS